MRDLTLAGSQIRLLAALRSSQMAPCLEQMFGPKISLDFKTTSLNISGSSRASPVDPVPTTLQFSHAAVRLGLLLFPLFALALDLPEDFFANKVSCHPRIMFPPTCCR